MRVRDIRPEDFDEIERINNQLVHRYDLDKYQFIIGGVAVDSEDRVVGFGGIKVVHECVLVTDQERSPKTRIEAARELMKEGIKRSIKLGIEFWHAFCDQKFAIFLIKWFDFKPAEGESIILTVDRRYHVEERGKSDEGEACTGSSLSGAEVRGNHKRAGT